MSDLNFQNISTVQSNEQPYPVTVTAAATIAPTTFLTFVTGTTNLATITPPVTGAHMLAMVFSTTALQVVTTGNILVGSTTIVANVPVLFFYNPITAKYSIMRGTV